jgi:tetratricopeptide (TPR) repeat protein
VSDDTRRETWCLDAETLAAFIDLRLSAEARTVCEAHMAECDDCYEAFIETIRAMEEDRAAGVAHAAGAAGSGTMNAARPSAPRWYVVAGAIAATLVLAVVGWRLLAARGSALDREVAALVASDTSVRPSVARLTPFPWAPPPAVERGATSRTVSPETTIAAARIAQRVTTDRSAAALQAYAAAQLVLGQTDNAVTALEEAARTAPTAAPVWADLSAAYYEKSSSAEGAVNLPKGLEAANTAIALGGADAAAWFNKALLLERLHTRDQAIAAWKRFLEIDGTSNWAREARQRLADLEKGAATSRPADTQAQRDALLDDVLARWGDAVTHHDAPRAADALRQAHRIADDLTRQANDSFARDVFERTATVPARAIAALAAAHVAYGAARASYRREDYDAAAPRFTEAARQFAVAGSAAEYAARLHSGIILFRRSLHPQAVSALRALRSDAQAHGYAGIGGRAAWVEGLALDVSGFARDATGRYADATTLLRAAGEYGNAAFVDGLLASQFDRLGNPEQAWSVWSGAFEGTGREGTLLSAAVSATRLGWPRTALDLQVAAAEAARKGARPAGVADALRWQAVSETQLGRPAEARRRIAEAQAVAAGREGAAWDRIRAEIDLANANVEGGAPPADRIASATRALTYFRGGHAATRLPEILLARAVARDASGDVDAAYADALEGTRVLASLREHVAAGTDQVRFSDVVRRLLATVVDLADRRGRLRDAFEVVEDARARDLPDATTPMTLVDLERFVPPGTTLATFVVGRDRSYAWIIRHGGSTVSRIAASRQAIADLAEQAGPPRFEPAAARRLRALVLDPVIAGVGPDDVVVIVPDGPLHGVSFAALPGIHSRYLVEEIAIAVSPSCRAWMFGASRLLASGSPRPRAFVAGNPRVDPRRFGMLPDLPSANAEAQEVAALYRTTAVTDREVTAPAVMNGLHSDVVHFAGHAVINEHQPELSALVVWDPDGAGVSSGLIRTQQLRGTKLVVLAACRSSSGTGSRTEGPISLARAFLAAGVTNVVASQWVADDRASKELMIRFHQAYLGGGDAARALSLAQRALIRSPEESMRNPRSWAGFAAFGATVPAALPRP